ncbi:homeobox-DDT domain protein RLT1 isoform X2 [Daucus carota subsp. sativus]|uniref:homeobox-DDT domain protein RLT1 isoform X2 n=1 Tax=Daucus carota subsp. sativus TaxID=79200 RepID=UPI0007F03E52|nr:PREDICTED: homeobox-DDT domain protein RLT1-like isoform X2 [Daucus carota subsp. sativus]
MEAGGSEGDRTGDGSVKPKRQMKTPFQLEALERTYAAETYPSEATRADLSVLLGLTDRQLQMWFCHRRLKDKKEGAAKNQLATPVARKGSFDSHTDELKVVELGRDNGSGSRSRSGSGSDSSQFSDPEDMPLRWQYELSPQSAKVQRVISCIEAQLGGPLREDGPIIGVDFDEIPPGADRTSIGRMEHRERSKNSHDGQLYERAKPSKSKAALGGVCEPAELNNKADGYRRSPSNFYDLSPDNPSSKRSFMQGNKQWSRQYVAQVQVSGVGQFSQEGKQAQFLSSSVGNDYFQNAEEPLPLGKKRKNEDRIDMEVSHEKKSRRDLEKEDLLRRKRDEQMKKEMEKQDRERRKEEERLLREKQRREEKYQREERREHERRERFLQKELLKVERKKQMEEVRREREAAKQKITMERAALRRIAKESLELIEDERLELMELAASSRGLPSIVALDYETLQNLESFRDQLCTFPPKSVHLKKPFSIKPWNDSEDNIGNLFMVWRFCNTFLDVLGLWPFTLDEFIQALHEYDSRLLAEIHIALLKLVVRDIEEGARTQCGGTGTNQYTAANPEGGHPQIVEGAFKWGFDIRYWKKHLNPLTWPEILRQFGLSAGCGPQLTKGSEENANLHDKDEAKGCEDVVSMLRDGSAVENAVNVMKEKGLPQQRKSRNRLTPGTIKFAAYHILCLEGSKGLTLIELADKIQKSGLRDLSTSKTPDATVSVALSRDPTLFVRIAPLTYCVRPAFRKDPADGEAVIAAARDEIQKFLNGSLTEETNGDAEKDDDSDSDIADGLEGDEIATPVGVNKISDDFKESGTLLATSNNSSHHDMQSTLKSNPDTADDAESDHFQGLMGVDESNSGEPWVQGLTEGEYCDLCVEERLCALVVLISVVNEGNIVRAVLEDRLDAANALKKQMWSETQLGKRRMKEDNLAKFNDFSVTAAADSSQSQLRVVQNRVDELALVVSEAHPVDLENVHKDDNYPNGVVNERSLIVHDSCISQIIPSIQHDALKSERSRMQLKSYIGHRAEEMHVYRSLPLGQDRRHNRYWKFVASGSRHDPGSGRIFVELCEGYWRLIDSEEAFDALLMSLDTRGLRESHLHIMLRHSETSFKDNLRKNLQSSCDETGTVPKVEPTELSSNALCIYSGKRDSNSDMESSSLRVELGINETEKINAFRRYQDLESWMWKECFNSSNLCAMRNGQKAITPVLWICDFCLNTFILKEHNCPSCQREISTFGNRFTYLEPAIQSEDQKEINFRNPVVSDPFFTFKIRMMKSLLAFVEVSVSSEAFQSFWSRGRRNWGLNLQNASSVEDILQILIQFEGGIKRDWLASDFETTTELNSCAFPGKIVTQSDKSVAQLPWLPRTSAAVALRLFELDSSIFYSEHQKAEAYSMTEIAKFELPTKFANMKDVQHVELTGVHQRENKASSGAMRGISACRQAISSRGGAQPRGRVQKKIHKSRSKPVRRSNKVKKTMAPGFMQQEKKAYYQKQGHGYNHGPRTVRKRRETMDVEEMQLGHFVELQEHRSLDGIGISHSPNNANMKWVEESGKLQDAGTGNCDSTEASESDEGADATRYRHLHVEPSFGAPSDRSARDMVETSDDDAEIDDVHDYEDDNNIDDVIMNDGPHGNNVESLETSGDYSDSSGMD